MGNALSSAIKSIDGSSDAEKEIKDALNALYALGESRNDAAFAKATSEALKVYAPISKVLLQRQSIVASASVDTDGIVNGIKSAVGNLMKGQILDGVTDIISNALNIVLGASSGQISSMHEYALIATDLGALLRLDIDVYSFEITSTGLQSHAKNMTAVSSLISTVNPNAIGLGDIRGIVSLSYGNSDIETQKSIFELVKTAWENDRKVMVGQSLSLEDHERFQSLLQDSKHEKAMLARRAARPKTLSLSERPRPRVGRNAMLKAAMKVKAERSQARRPLATSMSLAEDGTNGTNGETQANGANGATGANGTAPSLPDPTGQLFIWAQLSEPVDDDWVARARGALSGFNVQGMFKFDDIAGGKSGNAISFRCLVPTDVENFDLGVAYVNDTVLTAFTQATYLSSYITSMAVQYDHPSLNVNSNGLLTLVNFKENSVTNKSPTDTVIFYEPDSFEVMLTLAPGQSGILNGLISHIATAVPQQTGGDQGEGEAGSAAAKSTGKLWVTYEAAPAIVTKVGMDLYPLPGTGGYSLEFHGGNNDALEYINYDSAWIAAATATTK